MDVSDKIRRLRNEKGYSQQYLALKLGISQNAYHKLEKGETKLSFERLQQLATVLEVSIEELTEQSKESGTANEKRLESLEKEVNDLKSVLKVLKNGEGE